MAKSAQSRSMPQPRSGPGRPPKADVETDLRDRILDIAEEQFARLGFEAVTLRDVARRVGATPAMIHYYFESKRQLFDAVFARRADIVNADRLEALNSYERAAGESVTVEGAIAAFLSPVLHRLANGGPGWRHYLELVALIGHNTEWGGEVMTRSFDPVIQRMIAIIRRAMPKAKDVDLYWGYHFLSGALLLTLSETDRIDRLSGGVCRSTDIAAIEPRIVAFTAAGFKSICER